jgi:hypothetical protein
MSKKIVKNILLVFVIVYTILIGFAVTEIGRRKVLYDTVNQMRPENRTMEMYEELEQNAESQIDNLREMFSNEESDVPVPAKQLALVQMYMMGAGHILEIQIFILICSICLSIVIGMIISLEEKSKVKHILIFILLGLILSIIGALLMGVSNENFFETFFENLLDMLKMYGIYYILIYIVTFLTRYFVNKNKTNKLNEELKNKQK